MPKFLPLKPVLGLMAAHLAFLLITTAAQAGERPRVGLALGGGGARGAAHIGILKVLERNNIPVDCIAGTSMGAVVGSLYAAGFTADEIEQILADIDWTDALRDGPPRIKNPIRRKSEDIELNVRYRLGLSGGGVVTPPGLLNGQNLDLLFREIMEPVSHIHDFDQLPIPFRAVATDLGVGETVVICAGDLVRAVRASMSVPGAFTPVDWKERVLVDGGVVNNVPAGIVRDMGADIVIAVDVGSGLADVETLKSALAVSLQSTQILLVNHTQELMKLLEEDDIFIRADPEGIGGADFPRALEAVPVGEEACADVMVALKKLAVSPANYQSWRRAHTRPTLQKPLITAIEVDDRQAPGSAALVRARISQPLGRPLDLPALKDDIDRIFGIGRFSLIDYQLFPHEGGRKLVLQPVEHNWGSTAMRFGMGFSDDFDGSRNYQVLLETLTFSREKRGREWRLRLGLGESSGLSAEVMQPLDLRNRYFTRLEGTLRQTEIGLIESDQRLGKYATTELFGKASLGRNFGSNWELTANVYHGRTWLDARAGFAYLVPEIDRGMGRGGLQIVHDTFNDFAFPTSGRRFLARVEWPATFLGAEINNRRTEWHLDQAFSFGEHSFLLGLYGAEVDKTTLGVDGLTLLGGMFHLSGYRQDEIFGDEYLLTRLIYYKYGGGGRRSMVGAPFVMGASLEYGEAWEEDEPWRLDDMLWSGSVFAGIDTFLGSMYMGLGVAEEGRHAVYFAFGPLFHLGRETAHGTI